MGKMKKWIAGVLACAMTLGMGTAALAAEEIPASGPTESVNISKLYKSTVAETSLGETFQFTVDASGVTESAYTTAPALQGFSIEYAAGEATVAGEKKIAKIDLVPLDKVGIYTYTISETSGSTAGVTYDNAPVTMTVTVINGNDGLEKYVTLKKNDAKLGANDAAFTNNYQTGNLSISKTVEGNLGDKDKYFDFTVTLTGEEGKTYPATYKMEGGSYKQNPTTIKVGEETSIKLKHGETIAIANLPYNVSYVVTEDGVEGYTVGKTGDTGIISSASSTAAFTNTKNGNIDTGVILDSLPYIIIFAVVIAAAVVALISRKRRFQD